MPPSGDCRLPPISSSSGCPLTRISTGDLLPWLLGNYPGSTLLWSSPSLACAWYFRPRGISACAFSLAIANQVLKFRTKAQTRVTPPCTPDIARPVSRLLPCSSRPWQAVPVLMSSKWCFEASWFTSAEACQVARPLCGSDRELPSHRDFYFQASVESVTLLGAGYNYDSHWMALSMG